LPRPTLTLLVLALLAASPALAQTPPPPAVTVAPAELVAIAETASFNGRAVAAERVDIRARVTGFVTERDFAEGGRVAAGEILFRIDDAAFRAELTQAEASVQAAEAALTLALIERDRQQELVGRGAASQAVLDRAVAEAARAEAEVKRLGALRDNAALDLSYTEIRAPFAGQVGFATADVGALIGPDSGALVTLVSTDPMTVEFPVPERELLRIRTEIGPGSEIESVRLTLSDGSLYPEGGRIDFADVVVAQGTDTVTVRAIFPNPDTLLRDGSLVSVMIEGAPPAPSLTVPQQAIQRDLLGAFVLVVDANGLVEQRRVEVARLARGIAILGSGLEEGERVITEGANKARPGGTVNAALAGEG
jgi:membrane fusion protein (multidrug efflux system)